MDKRNPRYINVAKFISYCDKNNITISRMDYSKSKVVNLSANELIDEFDYFMTMDDCYNNLHSRICSIITSHESFDKNTGELYPDTKFVSPQHLADELTRKILDDENISRILQLYYQSRNNNGEENG